LKRPSRLDLPSRSMEPQINTWILRCRAPTDSVHACTRNGEIDLLSPTSPPPSIHRTRIVSCRTMSSVPLSSAVNAVACLAFRMNEMRGDAAALERINGMQFRPPAPLAIDNHRKRNKDAERGAERDGHISRDQSRYYAAKDEQPSRAGLPHKGAPLDHPLFIS